MDNKKYMNKYIFENGYKLEFEGELYPRKALRYINGYIDAGKSRKHLVEKTQNECIRQQLQKNVVYPFIDPEDMKYNNEISLLCIFNTNDLSEICMEDLISGWTMYIGIGEAVAKKHIGNGEYLPELYINSTLTPLNRSTICMVEEFLEEIKEYSHDLYKNIELVGSLGRGEPSGHDIDFIIHKNYKDDIETFMSDYIHISGSSWCAILDNKLIRIDISFYLDSYYIPFKVHYTGPVAKNIRYRRAAIKKGYSLSQYGLKDRKGNMVYIDSEEMLLKIIGL